MRNMDWIRPIQSITCSHLFSLNRLWPYSSEWNFNKLIKRPFGESEVVNGMGVWAAMGDEYLNSCSE